MLENRLRAVGQVERLELGGEDRSQLGVAAAFGEEVGALLGERDEIERRHAVGGRTLD